VIFVPMMCFMPDRMQLPTEETAMSRNRFRPLMALVASALGLVALLAAPSGAAAKDRNHDRIPDRWEKGHHLSLKVNQARRDQDRDGLRNRGEFLADDKPHDQDTDGDGTEDGDENAGTIDSFSGGVLKINLFAGGTLTGTVTAGTEIECENEDENEAGDDRRSREGENSGPSDNSGPGSENSGNNEGDENDEQDEVSCSTADLTQGAVVHEAELEASGAGAVFEEIELA
jgi:hypothetical protein